MSGNEITDLIIAELDRYGLKGKIVDLSKRLAVEYETPEGSRRITCAKTPSDWRAGMNQRSQLRRMLREDGMQIVEQSPTSFVKAMSLPKESLVSSVSRERAMQKDIEVLSDLAFDIDEKLDKLISKLESITVVSTVTSTLGIVDQPEYQPPPDIREKVKRGEVSVLSVMTFEYTDVREIIRKMGNMVTGKSIRAQLQYNLKKGRVERGLRGQYRKKTN